MMLTATGGLLGSVLVGVIVWFVLFVILGVTLWVCFVAGAAVLVAGLLVTGPLAMSRAKKSAGRGQSGSAIGAH
jgi:hypothetical protein